MVNPVQPQFIFGPSQEQILLHGVPMVWAPESDLVAHLELPPWSNNFGFSSE
jgi:hypothetical protein